MKKPISPYFILTIALTAIILTIIFTVKTEESCDTVKTVLTSVNIKPSEGRNYMGFDLNKHNLTFGTLSPGGTARRTASSEYTKDAITHVWAEGDFSSWIIISPKTFEIKPGQKQEVVFTLLIPATAKEGEYGGRIVFCYQDK
ncbi:MAG: hypothetical protein AABX31_01605 [Nanoarchaeota archaeon]